MSFDRGRHAATVDRPTLRNRRRTHLAALHATVKARQDLTGRLASHRGVSWVIVVRYDNPRRPVDVGCDYRNGGWWFCRLADGALIARAEEVAQCAEVIARELGRA